MHQHILFGTMHQNFGNMAALNTACVVKGEVDSAATHKSTRQRRTGRMS